ncbi:MarR family winged helix-turn-helix transcriptional regulator [Allosphingosinicella flava]|uniref:MarR family winged helix-turn-helix transcriptional regulator n=1 Tax=Allosphingosinicella flava TaxID=2771430 RepID=UPI001A9C49D8|nr:MarR family winged helix-turn-helix transcriptional regulator [Sphingosinicella flava]
MIRTTTEAIEALRAFNRFHTQFFGVLEASFMGSGLSLAEARVLFEIARCQPVPASGIQAELGLDAGYLSRMIRRFEASELVYRDRGVDARQRPISLTVKGRDVLGAVDSEVQQDVAASIAHLDSLDRAALVEALQTVTALLSRGKAER